MNKAQVEHHVEHVVSKVEPDLRYVGVITLTAGPFNLILRSAPYQNRFGAESWNKLTLALVGGMEVRAEIECSLQWGEYHVWGEMKVPVTPEEK